MECMSDLPQVATRTTLMRPRFLRRCCLSQGANSQQLGIFLCMRCASIHRKLGTHISKVKSLSMDGWSNEQVEVGTGSGAEETPGTAADERRRI